MSRRQRASARGGRPASPARRVAGRRRTLPRTARAVPVAIALLAGCGGATGGAAGAASPSARSLAEYDLARDAFQRSERREALAHVQKALELDDSNADAAHLGALILVSFCALSESSPDCRYAEAERYARMAVDANPELRDAKNLLGVILIALERHAEAIAVLDPLARDMLYATPEKAWGNLGWAHLLRGDVDRAIDALRRAVAAQPLFCVGQYRLGLAYEKKGELAAARDALSRAVDTQQPECQRLQEAFDARARIAMRQGKGDDARADLERCKAISGHTPVGRRCAAALLTLQ